MKILALDLGTTTGWALGANGFTESGVQVFDVKRGESPGMRYVRFNRWLDEMADLKPMELIVYEQAHQRGGPATEVAAGFTTRVQEFCARRGIEHASVHSATLKRFVLGTAPKRKKGEPMFDRSKARMVEMVERRWLLVPADDNEADAIALLMYARETYG